MAGNDDGQAINFLNLQGLNAVQASQFAELLGRGAAQGQIPQQQQQVQVQQLLQHHLQQQELQNSASLAGGTPSFSPWLSAAAMNRLMPQPTAGVLPSGGGRRVVWRARVQIRCSCRRSERRCFGWYGRIQRRRAQQSP